MDPKDARVTGALRVGESPSAIPLLSLLEQLEDVLARMDEQGLSLAANYVSQGIELIRVELNSIQSGDT